MQVHIRIYGQVQGVFFRGGAKEEADKLGLVGWARNDRDGSVEILAVGSKSNLDKFVAWCRKGPPGAQVERVQVDWSQANGNFKSFEILRD